MIRIKVVIAEDARGPDVNMGVKICKEVVNSVTLFSNGGAGITSSGDGLEEWVMESKDICQALKLEGREDGVVPADSSSSN